jgi:uncharacterized membrane protein
MRAETKTPALLDRRLAGLLSYGTWIASALIAAGLALPLIGVNPAIEDVQLVTAGIAVIITLPVLRVIMMCFSFLHERDLGFAAVAAFVLAIIAISLIIGATATRQTTLGDLTIGALERLFTKNRVGDTQTWPALRNLFAERIFAALWTSASSNTIAGAWPRAPS